MKWKRFFLNFKVNITRKLYVLCNQLNNINLWQLDKKSFIEMIYMIYFIIIIIAEQCSTSENHAFTIVPSSTINDDVYSPTTFDEGIVSHDLINIYNTICF